MSFRLRLVYFLVHQLQLTNNEAKRLILEGKILVNGSAAKENVLLPADAAVIVNGVTVRSEVKKRLVLFNKPRGYESTLSEKVKNNISPFIKDNEGLIIAGRLDKDSEGLLLISNDGKWVEKICQPNYKKEKEYLVELDRTHNDAFFKNFRQGVRLGNYTTRPCTCEPIDDKLIRVVLNEGKNRQIRRMCWNLGFGVVTLKRIRIDRFDLGDLLPGESKEIHMEEETYKRPLPL